MMRAMRYLAMTAALGVMAACGASAPEEEGFRFKEGLSYAVVAAEPALGTGDALTYCDLSTAASYRVMGDNKPYATCNHAYFTVGDYDTAERDGTQGHGLSLADGTIVTAYEITAADRGLFAPVALRTENGKATEVMLGTLPLHRITPGTIHILGATRNEGARLRTSFIEIYPEHSQRLSGAIEALLVPTCEEFSDPEGGASERYVGCTASRREIIVAEAPADPVPGMPPLFEGSSYDAFSFEQIKTFCAQTWTSRTGPGGRTEYNPCNRRDMFR